MYVGHVLDSPDYDGSDYGKIRVRLVGIELAEDENLIEDYAFPIDYNSVKFPLPGELVLIVQAFGDNVSQNIFTRRYYYVSNLTTRSSLSYNSNPDYGLSYKLKEGDQPENFLPENKIRFENKLKNRDSFFRNQTTVERKRLKAFEGDFILQSRFGSTLRLGSTGQNDSLGADGGNVWSKAGGISGNPITILAATRDTGFNEAGGLDRLEDVNKDDSSIYLCTSQVIPVELATSAELKSYRYIFNVPLGDTITTSDDITSFVETPEEEAQYYNTSGEDTDVGDIPVSTESSLEDVLNSVTDDMLELIPEQGNKFYDNKKRALKLALIDDKPIEYITAKAFLAMKKAAKEEGINLKLTSGYRPQFGSDKSITFVTKKGKQKRVNLTTQETLRKDRGRWRNRNKYKSDEEYVFKASSRDFVPPTAPPGTSKHGDGIAVDVNTGSRTGAIGPLSESVYKWMIKNAHKYGFVRTVSSEEWHFEFRPNLAAKGPYGGFERAIKDSKARASLLFYSDLGLDKLA